MIFRYDFGEKLDLSRFRKQAGSYIKRFQFHSVESPLEFHFYTTDFKIVLETEPTAEGLFKNKLSFFSIKRDADGQVKTTVALFPIGDSRFDSFKDVQSLFVQYSNKTEFTSSIEDTVEISCTFIKIVHKINHLKAFL